MSGSMERDEKRLDGQNRVTTGCQGKTSTQNMPRYFSLEGDSILPEVHLFFNSNESVPEICLTDCLG